MCGQYPRALKLFIQCGDRRIDEAIAVVGKSQSESLIHQLIDFLVGEKDGEILSYHLVIFYFFCQSTIVIVLS
jgi:hypothetical protein